MNPRVLFVDDEPRVLHALRRSLYAHKIAWEADFADTGAAALHLLDRAHYDVIVTDMSMAPMDGSELLRQVRDRRPATLRYVLSGHVETDAAVRALSVAQQLLSKPCDTRVLVEAVQSGLAVQQRLADPWVRAMVGRIRTLPAAPQVHAQISAALLDPRCDARRIAEILAHDPAIAANVLHLANSAFFNSAGRPAADLLQAVTRVGLNAVGDLVLATEVFDQRVHGPSANRLRGRALLASRLAQRIAAGKPYASTAATAALLADIGYLLPGVEANTADDSADWSEHAHAEIAASLLALWSLPLPIVEAVACHHSPARVPRSEFGVHGTVHVATALACRVEPDLDWLAQHGLSGQLAQWRDMSERQREQVAA